MTILEKIIVFFLILAVIAIVLMVMHGVTKFFVRHDNSSILFTILFIILLIFFLIIEIISDPNCMCISDSVIFANASKYAVAWMQTFINYISLAIIGFVILLAFRNVFMGERGVGCWAFFEWLPKLIPVFFSILGAKIVVTIFGCALCPLICNGIFKMADANQCVIATIRSWLGIN